MIACQSSSIQALYAFAYLSKVRNSSSVVAIHVLKLYTAHHPSYGNRLSSCKLQACKTCPESREEMPCLAYSFIRVSICLEMVTVLIKTDLLFQEDILVFSRQRLNISYSLFWPHHCCCFRLSRRDYLFLSLWQWLSLQDSSCNQCDLAQRCWSWKPGRDSPLSPAGKGRKQILLPRITAFKGCWQYMWPFFSERSLFPLLLTWFIQDWWRHHCLHFSDGKLSHEEGTCESFFRPVGNQEEKWGALSS